MLDHDWPVLASSVGERHVLCFNPLLAITSFNAPVKDGLENIVHKQKKKKNK